MYQHSPALIYRLLDIAVGHAEELLDVLLRIVTDIYVRILEEFGSFGVFLAGDVKNVCYSALYQAACFESRYEVADEESLAHWIQIVGLEQTVVLAAAEFHVWETAAQDIVLTAVIRWTLQLHSLRFFVKELVTFFVVSLSGVVHIG